MVFYICDLCSIVSVQRPINLNVLHPPLFVPISRAHIYPVKSTTVDEISTPILKKDPNLSTTIAAGSEYVPPYYASDKVTMQYKKSPFFVHFPTLKNVVFHHTN